MFNEIWERIKKETDIKTLKELAKKVETTQSYVSRKKQKNEFPVKWAYSIGREYSLLTEWIITGEGPKNLFATNEPDKLYTKKTIDQREPAEKDEIDFLLRKIKQWLLELKKENPKRISWFECILEDKIPEYREWAKSKRMEEKIKTSKERQEYIEKQAAA
ncbi:MAG: hypothetical protein D3923_13785 [Candidatus Electrothrix sp. AR3]|nr:hypothetical protein [Candidatus Electrothrix sp. AR3]